MSLLPPIVLPLPASYAAPTRQERRSETPLCVHGAGVYSQEAYAADDAAFLAEAFVLSNSRVVLVQDVKLPLATVLTALADPSIAPSRPPTMYTVRPDWHAPTTRSGVWVVYSTHEEASASLLLSHPSIATIEPALESDLLPHAKLERVLGVEEEDLHPLPATATSTATSTTSCSTPSSSSAPKTPESMLGGMTFHPTFGFGFGFGAAQETLAHLGVSEKTVQEKTSMGMGMGTGMGEKGQVKSRFMLSTNPPNPKISYRPGDWVCPLVPCGAYNFARNTMCIGCGHPHPYQQQQQQQHSSLHNAQQQQHMMATTHYGAAATTTIHAPLPLPLAQRQPPPHQQQQQQQLMYPHALPPISQHQQHQIPHQHQQQFISPRFAEDHHRRSRPLPPLPPLTTTGSTTPSRFATSLPGSRTTSPSRGSPPLQHSGGGLIFGTKPRTPTYPLLTPSGHALSAGGRVRNISVDPTYPCVMYWPENEPLPERGQIRPSGSQVVQYPPIVNTGNKGAAEKQPGDWTCSKCHYLNWRRRKVCQTCFPYAEGNGDSISQAVQAERIALLTNLLNQADPSYTHPLQRRVSAPLQLQYPVIGGGGGRHAAHASLSNPASYAPSPSPTASRSRSQADLRAQYMQQHQQQQRPIYQTAPYHASRNSSPARSSYAYNPTTTMGSRVPSPTSMFLPSCLQDVIQAESPLHSSPATSASSAELSFDDFGAYDYPAYHHPDSPHHDSSHDDEDEGDVASEEDVRFRAPGGATRSGRAVFVNGSATKNTREEREGVASIWRMDGEESRTLRPYAPIHAECGIQELAGRLAGGLSLASA